ncbi:MAG: AAA family ATPase, partial [Planctomycetota bacterium]
RPVDGVPDPHLHAHCYVFNTTFDETEDRWKAGQFRNLKRDAPYFEAVFHSRLAHRLTEIGLPIERTPKGWELEGIDKELVEKFSRRTRQIEEKAREMGIDSVDAKAQLGAKTREHKQRNLSFAELQQSWQDRMTEQERESLASLERKLGDETEASDSSAAARGLDYAVKHSFERKSVVPERTLLAAALKLSVGKATVEDVQREYEQSDVIRATRRDQKMVTTKEVLQEEKRLIDFAKQGRGTCRPYVRRLDSVKRDWLNDAQQKAVKHIVESRDRVIIVRGAAGVGKTTLMQEAVESIEASGTKVYAFAPSADASRGTLREAGFKDADTVASLLNNQEKQKQVEGQLIWIDEAGLMGTKTMADVFALAERLDSRLLLSGDRYQHGSVERGAALKLLENEAGIRPAEVKEIQRQKGAYKEAIKALSEGQAASGFSKLDELGWIHEVPHEERYKEIAADYVRATLEHKSSLVVSPTHAEGARITAEIRQNLKTLGQLDEDERTFRVLHNANLTEAERGERSNFETGDMLVFHQNAKGHKRGDRINVQSDSKLPLDQAARFQLFRSSELSLAPGDKVRITQNGMSADGKHRLNNGALYQIAKFDDAGNIVLNNGWTVDKDFGYLAHGYVVTSHSSQGKTVDRVFVGQSSESFPASSREQFYVSASRAKEKVTVYTDNNEELLDAVSKSDERLEPRRSSFAIGLTVSELAMRTHVRRSRENLERQKERELIYERE